MRAAAGLCILLLIFLVASDKGFALLCNVCDSNASWEDCEASKLEMDCPAEVNERCLDLEIRIAEGVFYYHKTCAMAQFCDTFCDDYKAQGIPCYLKCCTGDLCNEGSKNRPFPE